MKDLVTVIKYLKKGIKVEAVPYGMGNPWSNDEDLSDCPKTEQIWRNYGRKQPHRRYQSPGKPYLAA